MLNAQRRLLSILLPITFAALIVMFLYEVVWFTTAKKTKAVIVSVEEVKMKNSADTDYTQLKVRIHNDPTSSTETLRPLHIAPDFKPGSSIPVRVRDTGKIITDNPIENFSWTFILLIALITEVMFFIPVRFMYNKLSSDFANEQNQNL